MRCANCPHNLDALHERGLRMLRTLRQGARYIVVAETDADTHPVTFDVGSTAEAIERIDVRLRGMRSEALTVPDGSSEEPGL